MTAFKLDEFLSTITVEDVTDDENKLGFARKMVARAYSRFSSGALSIEEVFEDLYANSGPESGTFRTVLASTLDASNGQLVPLGTSSVFISPDHGEQIIPFDFMQLFNVDEMEFEYHNSCELRRLAIADFCLKGKYRMANAHIEVVKLVHSKTIEIGRRFGKTQFLSIMPYYVQSTLRKAGFHSEAVEGAILDYETKPDLFEKYDWYWKRNRPQVFRFLN